MLRPLKSCLWCTIYTIMLLFLPGCWSGHELTDRLIVLGISLDDVGGKIRLTLQGVRPEASISSMSTPTSSTDTSSSSAFSLLTADGKSVQEALQKIDQIAPRFLYTGHNEVFFIGEDLAKKGIMPYLDLFARSQWGQESTWVIIAKGGTGQQLLTSTNLLSKYPSMGLGEMVRKHQIQITTLYKFLLRYHGESGSQILVNAIDIQNSTAPQGYQINQLLLQRCAIFQKDKLVGYLSDLDGEAYNWFENGFKNTRFSFLNAQETPSPLTGVVLNSSPGVIRVSTTPELRVQIKVTCDFYVTEYTTGPLNSPADIRLLENKLDDVLCQRFNQLFSKLKENKADVFDIAEKMRAYHLPQWKEVQDTWPDVFANLPIEITVTSHFRNSSVMLKYPGLNN